MSIYKVGQQKCKNSIQVLSTKGSEKNKGEVPSVNKFA